MEIPRFKMSLLPEKERRSNCIRFHINLLTPSPFAPGVPTSPLGPGRP